jgi:hypothetical protein
MELSLLVALPDTQRMLIPDGQPAVAEIIATETKELRKEPEAPAGKQSPVDTKSAFQAYLPLHKPRGFFTDLGALAI